MPGFGSVGVWEVILILAVLLLVFGAKRLPEIGSALGKGIREFKGSVRDIESEIHRPADHRGDLPRSETSRETPRSEPGVEPRRESTPAEGSAPSTSGAELPRGDTERRTGE